MEGERGHSSSLTAEILQEVYVPSLPILLLASLLHVVVNALFTAVTRKDMMFRATIQRWSRALWLQQKSTFVLVQPTRNPLQSLMPSPPRPGVHRGTKRSKSGAGVGGHGDATEAASASQPLLRKDRAHGSYDATGGVRGKASPEEVPTYHGNASFFRNLDASRLLGRDEAGGALDTPPSTTVVASPVFAEVIQQSRADVRRESQRLLLPFNAVFMILSACKCFLILIYIHYHFVEIEGGWRRLCVCGTANIMAGAITPVLGYAAAFLLPVAGTPSSLGGGTGGAIASEEAKDSVFIVQLLLQISRVELDDLPTVLVQGTAFVDLTAVLLPVFIAVGVTGAVAYAWLVAVPWVVWYCVRRWYYQSQSSSADATTAAGASAGGAEMPSKLRAFLGSFSELARVLLLKTCTIWLLQWTVQTTLLLGLGLRGNGDSLSWQLYTSTVRDVRSLQLRWVPVALWPSLSVFMRVCFLSLLLF